LHEWDRKLAKSMKLKKIGRNKERKQKEINKGKQ
jgi:hypothetical protein